MASLVSNKQPNAVSSLSILGIPIPNAYTNIAYTPETVECNDTESLVGVDKFGGQFIYATSKTEIWPTCHQCSHRLSFMFQCQNPITSLTVNNTEIVTQTTTPLTTSDNSHFQFFICTHWECNAGGCQKCKSEGPCFLISSFDPTKENQKIIDVLDITSPMPCFKIEKWNQCHEPKYYSQLRDYFKTLPDLATMVKIGSNYSDEKWETYITDLMQGKYSTKVRPISRDQAVLKAIEDSLEDEINDLISTGFKFGGTPASMESREDYTDYLQIHREPYFPYTWGDSGILHVSKDGKMDGDMC